MIPMHELQRLERALRRFREQFDLAYPHIGFDDSYKINVSDYASNMVETVRNADTALEYVLRWQEYRRHNKRDELK